MAPRGPEERSTKMGKKKSRLGSFFPCWLVGRRPAVVASLLNTAITKGRLRAGNWATEPGDNTPVALCVRPGVVQKKARELVLRKGDVVALMVHDRTGGDLLRAIAHVAHKWHLPLVSESGKKLTKRELGREQDAPPSADSGPAREPAWLYEVSSDLDRFKSIIERIEVEPSRYQDYAGWYGPSTGKIVIVELNPRRMVSTLIHEATHALDFELGQAERFSPAETEAVAHWVEFILTQRGLNLPRLYKLARAEGEPEWAIPRFLKTMRRRAIRLVRRHQQLFKLLLEWGKEQWYPKK